MQNKSIVIYKPAPIVIYKSEQLHELWLPVNGYESIYKVSTLGRLKNIARDKKRKGPQFIKQWLAKNPGSRKNRYNRYPCYTLCKNGKQLSIKAHRLVAETFLGKRKPGYQVNHKNGIKTDNRLNNLEYVTPKENIRHAREVLKVKIAKGESIVSSKLKTTEIIQIRNLRTNNMSIKDIAKIYSVSPSSISKIINRKSWKHVE